MVDAFNLVSRKVIFQKLHVVGGDIIQLIPFVCAFYAFESPSFYSHYNHDDNVVVIPSTMGTHQTSPLRGVLFALTHLKILLFTMAIFPFVYFHPL
jgi:hypothetical protein